MNELMAKMALGEIGVGLYLYSKWKKLKNQTSISVIGFDFAYGAGDGRTNVYGVSVILLNIGIAFLWKRRRVVKPTETDVALMAVQGKKGFLVARKTDLPCVQCPGCGGYLNEVGNETETGPMVVKMKCDKCGAEYGALALSEYIARFYPGAAEGKRKIGKGTLRVRATDLSKWLLNNDEDELMEWAASIPKDTAEKISEILYARASG